MCKFTRYIMQYYLSVHDAEEHEKEYSLKRIQHNKDVLECQGGITNCQESKYPGYTEQWS